MILVTGAAGHIGNVLVRRLLERGDSVRAMVLPGEDITSLDGLPVEIVEADICQPGMLERAVQGVTAIFHLAGVISITPDKDALAWKVNVQGTLNVIKAALSAGARMVYTSSIHAIARLPQGVTIDETAPFDPDNCAGGYDRSKAAASQEVLAAIAGGLDAVIVCPTGVIGPHDYRGSEMGQLILDCMHKKVQVSVEGGAYDFVDVRDVADGMLLAMDKGRRGQTYILSGEHIHLGRLMKLVRDFANIHSVYFELPAWFARFAARLAPAYYHLTRQRPLFTQYSLQTVLSNSAISSRKARFELGYQPRPLADSVSDTVHWLRDWRR